MDKLRELLAQMCAGIGQVLDNVLEDMEPCHFGGEASWQIELGSGHRHAYPDQQTPEDPSEVSTSEQDIAQTADVETADVGSKEQTNRTPTDDEKIVRVPEYWEEDALAPQEDSQIMAAPPVTSSPQDWQPQCPWCGRTNEYAYLMCDPSLPRICEGSH